MCAARPDLPCIAMCCGAGPDPNYVRTESEQAPKASVAEKWGLSHSHHLRIGIGFAPRMEALSMGEYNDAGLVVFGVDIKSRSAYLDSCEQVPWPPSPPSPNLQPIIKTHNPRSLYQNNHDDPFQDKGSRRPRRRRARPPHRLRLCRRRLHGAHPRSLLASPLRRGRVHRSAPVRLFRLHALAALDARFRQNLHGDPARRD